MDIKKLFTGGLLAAALVPLSAGAASVPVLDSDMTFSADGNFPTYVGDLNGTTADDSAGSFVGNDTAALINALPFGGGFEYVLRDNIGTADDGTGTWNGLSFSLTVTDSTSPGEWTLSWTDPVGGLSLPNVLDFAFALKGANDWAAWYFEAVRIELGDSPGTGSFVIRWTNQGGNIPALSHMTMYLRDSETPDEIPLPGAVWLFGSALVGLVTLQRRRRLAA